MFFINPLLAAIPINNIELPLESPFEDQQNDFSNPEINPLIEDIEFKEINSEDLEFEWLPSIKGKTPYSKKELKEIFSLCKRKDKLKTLSACAKALNEKLIDDGFINSRVFISKPEEKKNKFWQKQIFSNDLNGIMEVVLGQVLEIKVESTDNDLTKKIQEKLNRYNGKVLHLPSIEKALVEVRKIPDVGQIKGNMDRLGNDPTKAILNLTVTPSLSPWQRQVSVRNDGNAGTGAYKTTATFVKPNFLREFDSFISSFEIHNDSDPEIGAIVASTSYSFPLKNGKRFITSYAYGEREYVEYTDSLRDISFKTHHILGQFEKTIYSSKNQAWNAFVGLNINRTDSYLSGVRSDLVVGASDKGWVRTGHLKAGLNFNGSYQSKSWSGSIYGMQGISGISEDFQRADFEEDGIIPGEARAVGAKGNLAWTIKKGVGLNLGMSGQIAMNPLFNSMTFGLGSNAGIKGLPGSLTSGDSGWLGTSELVLTAWQKNKKAFQVVPFIGAGGVHTDLKGVKTKDAVGAGGIIARFIQPQVVMEVGWVDSFNTKNNSGVWNDWLLGDGIFTNIRYRF